MFFNFEKIMSDLKIACFLDFIQKRSEFTSKLEKVLNLSEYHYSALEKIKDTTNKNITKESKSNRHVYKEHLVSLIENTYSFFEYKYNVARILAYSGQTPSAIGIFERLVVILDLITFSLYFNEIKLEKTVLLLSKIKQIKTNSYLNLISLYKFTNNLLMNHILIENFNNINN